MKPFSKERAERRRKLLPEYIQTRIPEEENAVKTAIFTNLNECIKKKQSSGIEFWFLNLDSYLQNSLYSLTEEEMLNLLKLLYDFTTTMEYPRHALNAASLFVSLCHDYLNTEKLQLEWRPLFRILQTRLFTRSNITKGSNFVASTPQFFKLILKSSNFFEIGSAREMLSMWRKCFDPHHQDFVTAHCMLCLFLPVHTGEHKLWFNDFFSIWPMYSSIRWDYPFLLLYSRLSEYDYDDIDWSPHLPFLFNRLASYSHIPSATFQVIPEHITDYIIPDKLRNFFAEVESSNDLFPFFAKIIINLFSHQKAKEAVRTKFQELCFLLMPLYLPSICHSNPINTDLVACLVDAFTERYKKEQKYGPRHLPPLTQDDVEFFVSNLLPMVIADRFHANSSIDKIKDFAELSPEVIVPPLLETVKQCMQYEKLIDSAIETLASTISIIAYYQSFDLKELLHDIISHMKLADMRKTLKILFLFSIYGQCVEIDDSHEDLIVSFMTALFHICELIHKDDFRELKNFAKKAILSLLESASNKLVKRIVQLLYDASPNIHPSILADLIPCFFPKSLSIFSKQAFLGETEKQYAILQGMIDGSPSFIFENKDRILELIAKAQYSIDSHIKSRSSNIVKAMMKTLFTTFIPKLPRRSGFVSQDEINLIWSVPTDEQIEIIKEICNSFYDLMIKMYSSTDFQTKALGIKYGLNVAKYLAFVVSTSTDDRIESKYSYFQFPEIYLYTIPKLDEIWVKFRSFFITLISPETNVQILKVVLNFTIIMACPHAPFSHFFQDTHQEKQLIRTTNRVGLNDTYMYFYAKARDLMLFRLKCYREPYSKQIDEIIHKVIQCSVHHDKKIRLKTETFLTEMTSFCEFLVPISRLLMDMIPQYITDRNALSGILSNLQIFIPLNISLEPFPLLFDTALCICHNNLPLDMDDQPMLFRKVFLTICDLIDFYELDFSEGFMYQKRIDFVQKLPRLIVASKDKDQRFYLIYLSIKVCAGQKMVLSSELYSIWLQSLINDDEAIAHVLIRYLREYIEILIPRVPRRTRHKYSKLTEENYDTYLFEDSSEFSSKDHKHEILYLSREEYLDENVIKLYFPDDYQERIKIHKILFEFFVDDFSNVEKICDLFIHQQVHQNENFSQGRQITWSTLLRFFGMDFTYTLMDYCSLITVSNSILAQQSISSEIFAGILHSMKGHSFETLKKFKENKLDSFIHYLFTTFQSENFSFWCISFILGIALRDPLRFNFLFEILYDCIPKTFTQIRDVKVAMNICDILMEYAFFIPTIIDQFKEKLLFPLSENTTLLDYEFVRDSYSRVFGFVLASSFSFDSLTPDISVINLYYKLFESHNDDLLSISLLSNVYSQQSMSEFVLNQILQDKISLYLNLSLDKTPDQEKSANLALIRFIFSEWIWPCSPKPLTIEGASNIIDIVIGQLTPVNRQWQTQSVILTLIEIFASSNFFFLKDEHFDRLFDISLTAIQNTNCELQDVAAELMTLMLIASKHLNEKIPEHIETFRQMIYDENHVHRISGVKGIISIIQTGLFFDSVPSYIFDCLSLLQDVVEIDASLSSLISMALSEFNSNAQNNMLPHIAEQLSPYLTAAQPNYFS